jgi:hypothetical protein
VSIKLPKIWPALWEIGLAGPDETRPNASLNLKAVRSIGAELRTLHSDVLGEEVPDRMAELLRQLDEKGNAESN